jgi:hypothetical protein
MATLNERGAREMTAGLQDALARLRRRRAIVRQRLGELEVEDSDLGKIEAALIAAVEMASKPGAAP